MVRRPPFEMEGQAIRPGARGTVELPIARLATGSPVSLPVLIVHGRSEGPTVWIDAAVHGDEINGVEIIRRVLEQLDAKELRGTVLAVPVVNALGFMTGSRYLPDRRDLNRAFPGSTRGSLAGRIAALFLREIVELGPDVVSSFERKLGAVRPLLFPTSPAPVAAPPPASQPDAAK